MSDFILINEPVIRILAFVLLLSVMVVWETVAARRRQTIRRPIRWPGNLAIVALDTLAVRLIFPLTAVGVAVYASDQGWGLLNRVQVPNGVAIIFSMLVLDLAIYFQHRLFHAVPWLWRLHRMHHSDLEFDVTTGLRFHPFEILLSMGIKMAIVVLIGAPAVAVLAFEVLLNGASLFNHGNVGIPPRTDRWLRQIVVTPDMHRVHHSAIRSETDSNFGFSVPWWDRLFGTYRAQPEKGHLNMTIGIEDFRTIRDLRLDQMLIQPFRRPQTREKHPK